MYWKILKKKNDDCYSDPGATDERPLSEEECSRIDTNLRTLMDDITPPEIISYLYSKKCINDWQKEHLEKACKGMRKQNQELVEVLRRRSYANFKTFIEILRKTRHLNAAQVLEEGGGATELF